MPTSINKQAAKILATQLAGSDHQVVTVQKSAESYMKRPCADCPWRKDSVGIFPPEAFRISARTSYDMSDHLFGCHNSGTKKPKTCAGFLVSGSRHNLSYRLGLIHGKYRDVSDGGHDLFESYKSMAIANGVSPEDECLILSRDD